MNRRPPSSPIRLPLEQRLARLVADARRGVRPYLVAAQLGAPCTAVGCAIAALELGRMARAEVVYTEHMAADDWFTLGLITVVVCWLGWFALHCLLVTFSLRGYYRREYDYAARLLLAEGLGPVLAQEEYWRPLYGWRRGLAGTPKFSEMSSTLERHVAFAACFMESLRDISLGTGSLRRYYILQGYSRWQVDAAMRQPWMTLALPLGIGLLAAIETLMENGLTSLTTTQLGAYSVPVWPAALAVALGSWLVIGAFVGPHQLLMRGRTAALCDFLLGRLDDSSGVYAAPPGEEGWWPRRAFVSSMGRTAGRG